MVTALHIQNSYTTLGELPVITEMLRTGLQTPSGKVVVVGWAERSITRHLLTDRQQIPAAVMVGYAALHPPYIPGMFFSGTHLIAF
ncbi:MAG: hypothetical protein B6245_17165 [Desulfobacteraceae bacterium 4572_88]|nr:MAG: hypothetical protein B6245_17165 [Desulfobacteraceae bacterium 4572_88]